MREEEIAGIPKVERVDSSLLARKPRVIEISGFGFHMDGHSLLFEETMLLLDDNFKELTRLNFDLWKERNKPKGWRWLFWNPNRSQMESIGKAVLCFAPERIAYILSIQNTYERATEEYKKTLVLYKAPRDRSLMRTWAEGNFTDERENIQARIAALES